MIKRKFGLGLGEQRLEQQPASPTIPHVPADSDSLVPHLPHPMFEIPPVLRVPTPPSIQRDDSRFRGPVDSVDFSNPNPYGLFTATTTRTQQT